MLRILKKNKDNTTNASLTQAQPEKKSWFGKLSSGLKKTRNVLSISALFRNRKVDEEFLEELETQLLMADVGVEATQDLIETLKEQAKIQGITESEQLIDILKTQMINLLTPKADVFSTQAHSPYILLMIGVNGAGKTTTIGKLVKKFQAEGKSVLLAAGDTFRAAAIEQLQAWGERNNVDVIAQHSGADSASVVYDAVSAAKARKVDVIIADTAGRLHTQDGLMAELQKIKRVIQKLEETGPHETMLVLDASLGQNALNQAEQFHKAIEVSGITMTKLDGTAKGGVLFAITKKLQLPIRFIGVGEGVDDLRPFNAKEFVDALLTDEETS